MGLFDDDSNIILDELLEKAHAGIEAKLRKWAKPPSTTEQDKISRTERMVRDAIKSSDALKNSKRLLINLKKFALGILYLLKYLLLISSLSSQKRVSIFSLKKVRIF